MSAKELDQFYTKNTVAQQCWDYLNQTIDLSDIDHFLEPTAGEGAFYNLLPKDKRLGYDLEPKCEGVEKADYRTLFWQLPEGKIWTIGNPPFGSQSRGAVDCFNYCSAFSEGVSFIVPKTFRSVSVQNKMNLGFHLRGELGLDVESFTFRGKPYKVACVFQIWTPTGQRRVRVIPTTQDFEIYNWKANDEKANLWFQRRGDEGRFSFAKAGSVYTEFPEGIDPHTGALHSIVALEPEKVAAILSQVDWSRYRSTTSINRAAIIQAYNEAKEEQRAIIPDNRPTTHPDFKFHAKMSDRISVVFRHRANSKRHGKAYYTDNIDVRINDRTFYHLLECSDPEKVYRIANSIDWGPVIAKSGSGSIPQIDFIEQYALAGSDVPEAEGLTRETVIQAYTEAKEEQRTIIPDHRPTTHPDFEFTTKDKAQLAIRRVGVNAGKIYTDNYAHYSPKTNTFIRARDPEKTIRILSSIDWAPCMKHWVMGSLSRRDIIEQYALAGSDVPEAEGLIL